MTDVQDILSGFEKQSLEQSQRAKLQRRFDTKYIFHQGQLPQLLECLAEDYALIAETHDPAPLFQNIYFDTPDLRFYRQHHNGMLSRYKVRLRHYSDTGLSYLEVKQKNNKQQTRKERLKRASFDSKLDNQDFRFINEQIPIEAGCLKASLEVDFRRISLIHKTETERITIDLEPIFRFEGSTYKPEGLCIIELKQSSFSHQSDALACLRAAGIKRSGISKYCLGISNTRKHVKQNLFKRRQLRINRITHQAEFR